MKMLINGEWVTTPHKIAVHNPQNGEFVDSVPAASAEDMRAAIGYAVSAFENGSPPTHKRISILNTAADNIESDSEAFARIIAQEGIKTIREARKEVRRCVETIRISAEEARRLQGETISFDQMPGSEARQGYFIREPIGVIGAITPFNDPLNLVAHKVGPALAAGNAVIVKPDSKTPLSALLLAQAIQDAGLSAGFLQVVTGDGREIGETLVTDPRIRMISFTGGLKTGQHIMTQIGLKKVSMELGSNCPVIVMADADLDLAVESCVSGAYWAAGQNCLHVQRLLVQKPIRSEFVARFIAKAERYKVGDKLDDSTDMGPLINEEAAIRIETMVEEALKAGAELLTGGERHGTFYAPTLLAGVPDACRIATEEVYGPVTVLYEFDDINQAIQRANNVKFGLQSGIFTRDLNTAFQAAAQLQCGGVMINDSTDYRIDAMPFGGVKGSGIGREGIRFALQEMTEPKVICFNLPQIKDAL